MSTDIDTTALLSLVQSVATEAAKAPEKFMALSASLGGRLTKSGIWRLDYDGSGRLAGLQQVGPLTDCPGDGGAAGGSPKEGKGKQRPHGE
jgi:hypothetical protein